MTKEIAPPATNTIIHGNCIEIMSHLPARSVDFIVTDPPYIARYRPHKNNAGQTVSNDENGEWLKPSFAEMFPVLKNDSCAISFYGWPKLDLFSTPGNRRDFASPDTSCSAKVTRPNPHSWSTGMRQRFCWSKATRPFQPLLCPM